MTAERDIPELIAYTTELLVVYCFDFSKFPEVLTGGTLSSPAVPAVTNVTIGTPEVLASDFYEGSTSGPVAVASGKGVKVTLSSTTAARYSIACNVVIDGVTRTKRMIFDVR
jgi:hypothetical protein